MRLSEELKQHKGALFVTLTFNEQMYEETRKAVNAGWQPTYEEENEMCRYAIRHWLELIRKRTGKSVKHWIITEKGEEVEVSEKTIKHKDGKLERIVIRRKTAPSWTADAWYLERQFCEEFGLNRLDLKELLKILRASRAGKQVEERHGSEADQGNAKKDDERGAGSVT